MPIDRVLFAVNDEDDDRIEQAIDAVLDIVKPADAAVVVAHVVPDDVSRIPVNATPTVGMHHPHVLSEDEYDDLSDEHAVDDIVAERTAVRAVVDRLDDVGVDHEVCGAVGDPSKEIVALARELDVDRVVVNGRRRSPTDKVVFGSVAQTVLLESPCPVTFIQGA